jgi:hypothetical protein
MQFQAIKSNYNLYYHQWNTVQHICWSFVEHKLLRAVAGVNRVASMSVFLVFDRLKRLA